VDEWKSETRAGHSDRSCDCVDWCAFEFELTINKSNGFEG